MKKRLVANFKGKEYPIEDGSVFKDEYNEQLDSGTIILPHTKKLDIKPFEDIYIYGYGDTFNGVNTRYQVDYRTTKRLLNLEFDTLSITATWGESNVTTNDVYPIANYLCVVPNEYVGIDVDLPFGEFFDYCYFYKDVLEIPQDHTNKLFNIYNMRVLYKEDTMLDKAITLDSFDYDDFGVKLIFKTDTSPIQTLIGRVGEYNGLTCVIIEKPSGYMSTRGSNLEFSRLRKTYKITLTFDDSVFDTSVNMEGFLQGFWGQGEIVRFDLETHYIGLTDTLLFLGFDDSIEIDKHDTEVILTYEYNYTKGADVAFANLGIKKELQSITSYKPPKIDEPDNLKHLVVDSFIETQLDTEGKHFEYKITLFSETKLLEMIAITQKTFTSDFIGYETQGGVWTLLQRLVRLYSPKIKIQDSVDTWTHIDEFVLDETLLKPLFENIPIPDFTFEKTNLREVLTQLFLMRDMIPIVKHRVISGFDITRRNKKIVNTDENLPIRLQSSDDYATALITPHEQSISTRQATKSIEYIGFRNHEKGLMTLEDLELVFSKPIQKIDKIYMCYYKRFEILDKNNSHLRDEVVMVKQDITPIVVLQGTANVLSEDFYKMGQDRPTTIDELRTYKPCVIGYEVGSNVIKGWGTKFEWQTSSWWTYGNTYIHNLWAWFDIEFSAGINGVGYLVNEPDKEWAMAKSSGVVNSPHNLISPFEDEVKDNKIKGIFFQVEYTSFFEGATKHTKDKLVKEYQAIDNPSSSISWLDKLGSFQKEKLNRFANAIQVRTAIHKNINDIYELGDYDDNDYIVYSREYSIDAGSITANYKLIKDYVLKDYYTNVNTRLRPFALLSYKDSVMRKENRTSYLYFSSSECYYENVENFIDTQENILDLFLSGFEPNIKKNYIDFTEYPRVINFSYFEVDNVKYLSQFSKEAIGNSLIFNAVLPDNVSAGVFINSQYLAQELDDNTIGTPQLWYKFTNDMGYVEKIGFYFSHIDTQLQFGIEPFSDDNSTITKAIYNGLLFPMPKLNYTPQETNIIGKDYSFYKDNRETISFTSQFEYISELDNVLISNRFLELNDLINENEYKTNTSNYVDNILGLGGASFKLATWRVFDNHWDEAKMNNTPVIWVDIEDKDNVNNIETPILIHLKAPNHYDPDIYYTYEGYMTLLIDEFEKLDNNRFKAKVKEINGSAVRIGIFDYYLYLYSTPLNENIGEIIFYRNGHIPDQYENITLSGFSGNTFICPLAQFTLRVLIDSKVEDFYFVNSQKLIDGLPNSQFYRQFYSLQEVNYDSGSVKYDTHPVSFGTNIKRKLFYRNMYVYKIGDIDIKQLKDLKLTFSTIDNMFDNYGINATPRTIFNYGIDNQGRAYIDTPEPSVFYYRENASGYNSDKMSLCFANLKGKTYISLLTSKDQNVYSPYLVNVGTNKNYANTEESIKNEHFIDFFD